ncbi:protein-export chaperone SecB [Amphritea sp. 2_MG-2023]|uniref:protein-export chaperone SecB n=1 Tax=Amphritea TaxID=515417 RepID=UPI001C078306|nr:MULTISPECIES: protein-export chaperone SecB [Amphritea]MBU2966351.1 protein-export chaperone SecB [Amphritea atlantica]MDO6419790.1 protein-export chaperone SecB [Amphritea sp. 2_MG-2023]MDX2423936.1 protein-export chaperone SecB [Amphritea sp.]
MSGNYNESRNAENPFFALQKIYVKNSSFESPNTVRVFSDEWKPTVSMDLNTTYEQAEEGLYEVVLSVSITAKNHDQLAFIVEVDQAAIFMISGFPELQKTEALGVACPSVMFPYIRETIDHIMVKGGFPPLMMAPVNFDVLYAEKNRKSA